MYGYKTVGSSFKVCQLITLEGGFRADVIDLVNRWVQDIRGPYRQRKEVKLDTHEEIACFEGWFQRLVHMQS
jgi:hypothetical protein